MKIKWAIPALADLQNLHAYIADDNPRAAGKVVSKVRAAVTMLGSHSKMGRSGRVEGTRELVIGGTPFIVAYTIERDRIVIVAVIHSARRWPESFEND